MMNIATNAVTGTYLSRHIERAQNPGGSVQIFNYDKLLRKTRICTWIIITGLFISGATAFPLETELAWLVSHTTGWSPVLKGWLATVHHAIKVSNATYPFLSYGTDWLAFAHLMLAVLFAGVLRDPIRNKFIVQFGILACLMILPLAFIMGPLRHIPLFWTLVDCSFGIIGFIPLWVAYQCIKKIEHLNKRGL